MEMWRNWTIPIKYKLTFYTCIRKQTNDHQSSVELSIALRQAAAKVTGYHFKLYVLSVSLLFLIIAVISTNTSNPLNDTKICIIIVFELLCLLYSFVVGAERRDGSVWALHRWQYIGFTFTTNQILSKTERSVVIEYDKSFFIAAIRKICHQFYF